jgi:hypothetical protein
MNHSHEQQVDEMDLKLSQPATPGAARTLVWRASAFGPRNCASRRSTSSSARPRSHVASQGQRAPLLGISRFVRTLQQGGPRHGSQLAAGAAQFGRNVDGPSLSFITSFTAAGRNPRLPHASGRNHLSQPAATRCKSRTECLRRSASGMLMAANVHVHGTKVCPGCCLPRRRSAGRLEPGLAAQKRKRGARRGGEGTRALRR